jgi:hypothetical protein
MNLGTLRRIQRITHLFGAGLLLFAVYSGAITSEPWLGLIRFIVIPVLAVSGLAMWFAPKILRSAPQSGR